MERSGIGQFKGALSYEQVGEEFLKGGFNMIQVRFIGDNFALLTPKEAEDLKAIVAENKQWFDGVFSSVKPWSPEFVVDHKCVWMRCYGLPISLWNMDDFARAVGDEATLVSVDDATLSWDNLEFARVQVRTLRSSSSRWVKRMEFNDIMYNIVMEEEPPVGDGGVCKCNNFDSSDSASSSETYVEETSLSTSSCEENIREWERVSLRSKREDAEEEEKVRGKSGTNVTKLAVEVSSTGNRDGQRKSCFSCTKEVGATRRSMEGAEIGFLSAIACAPAFNCSPVQADLAKVVVDIESNFSVNHCGQGQDGMLEAQFGVGRYPIPAHDRVDGPRPDMKTCVREEASDAQMCGEQGSQTEPNDVPDDYEEGPQTDMEICAREKISEPQVYGEQGARTESNEHEGEDVGKCHTLNEEPRGGSAQAANGAVSEKEDAYGIMEEEELLRYEEGDITKKGNQSGVCTARTTGQSESPVRQRKEKGLTELGDSASIQRRRSARLKEKQALVGPGKHHQEGKISASISDGDINNCNYRLCEQAHGAEPAHLWEVGKLTGLVCHGDEEEVVLQYVGLEERDTKEVKQAKEGDREVVL